MNKVEYRGANSGAGPSPEIWAEFPILECMMDPERGLFYHEDWRHQNPIALNKDVDQDGYAVYTVNDAATIGASVGVAKTTNTAGLNAAAWTLAAGTSDNSEASMQWNNGGVCCEMDDGLSDLCFEASVYFSSITNGDGVFLVGLAEEDAPQNSLVVDDGATIAAIDFVGFMVQADDGDSLDAVYGTAAATPTVDGTYGTALVASTAVRVGMRYHGQKKVLQYFINGTQLGDDLPISTSGFPDGEELSPLFAVKCINAGVTTQKLGINWWRIGQKYYD